MMWALQGGSEVGVCVLSQLCCQRWMELLQVELLCWFHSGFTVKEPLPHFFFFFNLTIHLDVMCGLDVFITHTHSNVIQTLQIDIHSVLS